MGVRISYRYVSQWLILNCRKKQYDKISITLLVYLVYYNEIDFFSLNVIVLQNIQLKRLSNIALLLIVSIDFLTGVVLLFLSCNADAQIDHSVIKRQFSHNVWMNEPTKLVHAHIGILDLTKLEIT